MRVLPSQEEAQSYLNSAEKQKIGLSQMLEGALYIISVGEYTDKNLPESVEEEFGKLIEALVGDLGGVLGSELSLESMQTYLQKTTSRLPQSDAYSFRVLDRRDTKWAGKEDLASWLNQIEEGNSFSENIDAASEEYWVNMTMQIGAGGGMELLIRVEWEDDEEDLMKTDVHISGVENIWKVFESIMSNPLSREDTLMYNDDSVDTDQIFHALYDPALFKEMQVDGSRLGVLLKNIFSGELDEDEELSVLSLINEKSEWKLKIAESFKLWSLEKTQSFMFDGRDERDFEVYLAEDCEDMSQEGTVYHPESPYFQAILSFMRERRKKVLSSAIFFGVEQVVVEVTGKVDRRSVYVLSIKLGDLEYQIYVSPEEFHDFLLTVCDTDFPIEDSVVFHSSDEDFGWQPYEE